MVLIGIVVLAIVAGGVWFVKQTNKPDASVASKQSDGQTQLNLKFSDLQANYPQKPEACLATNDDAELTLDTASRTNIENSVVATIFDIPAGTNVDVHLKTYDKANATGTSIYESTYGSYNFTAKKMDAGVNKGSWIVTQFEACKK